MTDRIFATILMIVTLAYGLIAFTVIKAPFQYDPLGPESWPKLLAAVMVVCLIILFAKPDDLRFDLNRHAAVRVGAHVIMLLAYAELFQPLGFILATALYATVASRMIGAGWRGAVLFGLGMGVGGYLVCAGLLDLNLPAGPLPQL